MSELGPVDSDLDSVRVLCFCFLSCVLLKDKDAAMNEQHHSSFLPSDSQVCIRIRAKSPLMISSIDSAHFLKF